MSFFVSGNSKDVSFPKVDATPYDELMTAQKTTLIELKSVYGISQLRDIISGTVTNDGTGYNISVSEANDESSLVSAEKGRYVAGEGAIAGLSLRYDNAPTGNQVVEWGYFDDKNGFKFGEDATGKYVQVIRESSTVIKVYQQDWNLDTLLGDVSKKNPSGLKLDMTVGNIFQIPFTWYGYGIIEFRVIIRKGEEDILIPVHRFNPEGEQSVADPNLPITAKISNNGTATPFSMRVKGRHFSILGKYRPNRRVVSQSRLLQTISTTLTPLISFRKKSEFPLGKNNSVQTILSNLDILTSGDILYEVRLNGTLTNPNFVVPSDYDTNETACETDISATEITGGVPIWSGLASSLQGNQANLTSPEIVGISVPDNTNITLCARAISGSPSVSSVIRWTEEW